MEWKFKIWNQRDKEMEDNTWLHQTDAYGDIGFLEIISPNFCKEHGLDYRVLPYIGMETNSKHEIYIGDILRLTNPAGIKRDEIRGGHFEIDGQHFKTIPAEVTRIQSKCLSGKIDEIMVVIRQPVYLGFSADVYWRVDGRYGSASHLANCYLSALIAMGAEVIGNIFENPDIVPGYDGKSYEGTYPEMKFRIWDGKKEEMHDFDWIIEEDMEGSIPFLSMASEATNKEQAWDYHVMPYIGLKTRQNVEVYIGDILMLKYPYNLSNNEPDTMIMSIKEFETWGFNVSFYLGKGGAYKEIRRMENLKKYLIQAINLGAEVMGNIYENPDLDPALNSAKEQEELPGEWLKKLFM